MLLGKEREREREREREGGREGGREGDKVVSYVLTYTCLFITTKSSFLPKYFIHCTYLLKCKLPIHAIILSSSLTLSLQFSEWFHISYWSIMQ